MLRYALTIFLSAFLLFQVQPLIGNVILPWFGGTPAVWTTCMLFFQAALLLGYAYAHFLTSFVSRRGQTAVHIALLLTSLALLPIIVNLPGATDWKPTDAKMPIFRILLLLTTTIGLPYFLLSTTGPLLQESYRRETGQPPYRLYSLSNIGSLLALFSYPIFFEPWLRLKPQSFAWSFGYAAFVGLCGWCALSFMKPGHPQAESAKSAVPATARRGPGGIPTGFDMLIWLGLAACGSAMLLATTNQLCQEICSFPFLWIVPLGLYLLTFIMCFDADWWYHRGVFLPLLLAAVVGSCMSMYLGTKMALTPQVAIYSASMFVMCMVCHGELARSRPAAHYATLFYLLVSAGGVVGGLLVAVAAPLLLNNFWEYPIAIVATILMAFLGIVRDTPEDVAADQKAKGPQAAAKLAVPNVLMVFVAIIILGGALGGFATFMYSWQKKEHDPGNVDLLSTRNFYGVLHVNDRQVAADTNGTWRTLTHGRITHGIQYRDPSKQNWATSYYSHLSGVGLAVDQHPRRKSGEPMRLGVVGLGTGTLAVYGRPQDIVQFYEINPQVVAISMGDSTLDAALKAPSFPNLVDVDKDSDPYFTHCTNSAATVKVALGDARIVMEREAAALKKQADENGGNIVDDDRFDVLAIDAFSSDAIPRHLLTQESVALYMEKIKPDGILCMHVSNRFLDLRGIVKAIAEKLGHKCVLINNPGDGLMGINDSTWVLVTDNQDFLDMIERSVRIKKMPGMPVEGEDFKWVFVADPEKLKDSLNPGQAEHVVEERIITPWDEADTTEIIWNDDYASMWAAFKFGWESGGWEDVWDEFLSIFSWGKDDVEDEDMEEIIVGDDEFPRADQQ